MAEFPALTPPWSRLPLVHDDTALLPDETMDAIRADVREPLEQAVTELGADLETAQGTATAAQEAAAAAQLELDTRLSEAALNSAIGATVDEAVAELDVSGAVAEAIASDGTVVAAAVVAVGDAAEDLGIVYSEDSEDLADGEYGMRVSDEDEYLLRWDADGLTSPVPAAVVTNSAGGMFQEIQDDQGWNWFIGGYDLEGRLRVDVGQRTDGTRYPETWETAPAALDPVLLSGDSMVANWAYNSAAALSTQLGGRSLVFEGNGGKQSPFIAGRQGGRPWLVTVTGDALPASGSVAGTIAFPPLQASITSGLDFATGTYVGVLEGRRVSVTITSSAGAATITTTDAIARTTPCPPASPFKTGLTNQDHWPIIWSGRNNFYQPNDEQQIVNDIRGMLNHAHREDRALVLSIFPQVGETLGSETSNRRLARNARLAQEFPDQFEAVDSRMRSTALISAVGLTPTTQDAIDIAAGYTPESFRADSLHLNAKGYEALALLIGDIYTQRGWQ